MATLKQRLHRKNSSGTYDTIHLETSADLIVGTLGVAHGGTGVTTLNELKNQLGISSSGNITMETGTYIGNGTTSKTLTFNKSPYLIIIASGDFGPESSGFAGNGILWVPGVGTHQSTWSGNPMHITQQGNSITITPHQGIYLPNANNVVYRYVALTM